VVVAAGVLHLENEKGNLRGILATKRENCESFLDIQGALSKCNCDLLQMAPRWFVVWSQIQVRQVREVKAGATEVGLLSHGRKGKVEIIERIESGE